MSDLPLGYFLGELFGPDQGNDFGKLLLSFDLMEWAQDEIESAQQRHGETGEGPLFRTFPLLALPAEAGFELEPVYRAHCAELLDRVAAHKDLAPATDAEIIIALKSVSMIRPLNTASVTLYMRVFARRLPAMWEKASGQLIYQQLDLNPHEAELSLEAYESVHGRQADIIEEWARATVQATDRSGYDPHTVPEDPSDEQVGNDPVN